MKKQLYMFGIPRNFSITEVFRNTVFEIFILSYFKSIAFFVLRLQDVLKPAKEDSKKKSESQR